MSSDRAGKDARRQRIIAFSLVHTNITPSDPRVKIQAIVTAAQSQLQQLFDEMGQSVDIGQSIAALDKLDEARMHAERAYLLGSIRGENVAGPVTLTMPIQEQRAFAHGSVPKLKEQKLTPPSYNGPYDSDM